MNYKTMIIVVAWIFGLGHVWSQNVIPLTITEGDSYVLQCDSLNKIIQWQQSENNIDWKDISGATQALLRVNPDETTFYRAKFGESGCDQISAAACIQVINRPVCITDFDSDYINLTELRSCVYVPILDYYMGICRNTKHFSLSWKKGNALGVLISHDSEFLPEDGKTYEVDDPGVDYIGFGSSWYCDNFFRHYSDNVWVVKLYIYTFNKEYVYSDCESIELYVPPDITWSQVGCNCR